MGTKGSVLRGHQPIVKEEFNGLFIRGDKESCPPDHEPDNQNVQFIQSGVKTRDGLDIYEAYPIVLRIFTYIYLDGSDSFESLLILDASGHIFHDRSPTPFAPILTISGMTDFNMFDWDGRAYITPIGSDGQPLNNQSVWVYKGDGTPARLAGGNPPSGTLTLNQTGSGGSVEKGVHVLAVAFETDTGFITQIKAFASINIAANSSVINISTIPVSSDSFVVARRLVATVAIDPTLFTGDLENGYEFFFIPDGRIADNTTTTHNSSFFDSELLEDASYLLNLFSHIHAVRNLTAYNNRMCYLGTRDDISLIYVSAIGQPEAVDQVTGLLILPLDSTALTNGQAFRDVLYVFKAARTFAYNDNGGVPSTWPLTIIDEGIGASLHGVGTVLDSGGVNIDYLILIDFSGIILFNGSFIRPELSWKIKDYWFTLTRSQFPNIQIMNDSINQVLFITLPNQQMLIGDYSNGMNAKEIRWAKWKFDIETTTITLIEYNKLIIGSKTLRP